MVYPDFETELRKKLMKLVHVMNGSLRKVLNCILVLSVNKNVKVNI